MTVWCRYRTDKGASLGTIREGRIHQVSGDPFGEHAETGRSVPLASAQLLPPVIPPTFYAVGLNYRKHIEEGQARGYAVAKLPQRPEIGYRANNALIGHDEAIVKPADFTGTFEFEGELVVVIGRKVKKASRQEAQDSIFGWTIGNDVSAREWQTGDRTFWRGKNSDSFKPMGPHIVTDLDIGTAEARVRVNGEERNRYHVRDMIFDHLDYITEMSKYLTLHPGDVIWMGAEGTGVMAPGDTVEVEIDGIGTLRNPVVAEA